MSDYDIKITEGMLLNPSHDDTGYEISAGGAAMNPLIKLQDIYECHPCIDGWRKLLVALGYESCRDAENIAETKGLFDEGMVVSLGDIAISNNVSDSLWCVRALDWNDAAIRRRVISQVILPVVKRASANTTDVRVAECIAALQQWCDGDDGVDLIATADAAYASYDAAARVDAYADAAYAAYAAAAAAHAVAAAGAAADAVADAAADGADAAGAYNMERERQQQDIIAAFPPVLLTRKDGK